METEQVFVYGTLRPHREGVAYEDCRYWFRVQKEVHGAVPARMQGGLLYSFGTFPGAYPGEGEIVGDLLVVSPAGLAEMDRIEGNHDFFNRELVQVQTDTRFVDAWIYWGPPDLRTTGTIIPGGDWLKRTDQAESSTQADSPAR